MVGSPPPALDAVEIVWDERDTMLYALGVGAGQDAALPELALTVENLDGKPLQALPTFVAALLYPAAEVALDWFDWTDVLYAGHALRMHAPMPAAGAATARSRIVAVHDQGSGALVVVASDASSGGRPLATSTLTMFVRGAGGFGGPRAPSPPWAASDRAADQTLSYDVRPEQALLYRLSGDRNPLHADPRFAARSGFAAPILHGLCTFGIAGRLLIHAFGASDPASLGALSGRFTAPVMPGERLTVEAWHTSGRATFVVRGGDGRTVLDRGVCELAP